MGEKWYACGDEASMGRLVAHVRRERPDALVVPEGDPARLRHRLLCEVPGKASAVVGELGEGPAPVNVAACLVADGHAREVVLACPEAGGSLRSRAARAGVRVVTFDEMPPEAQAPASAAHAAPPRPRQDAGDDLDEPELAPAEAPDEDPGDGTRTSDQVPSATGCPVLCVASGRGGVGKSAVCALAALDAARWGMRVALVDLDLGSGNLYSYLGLPRSRDLGRLASLEAVGAGDAERLRVRVGDSLGLWGPCERPEMAEALQWRAGRLVELLSQSNDLVIVDTSTTFTDAVAQAAQLCDRLLLVADERQGAIGSLARAAALSVRLGVARTRIVRVMNRCESRQRDDALAYAGQTGLETARCVRLLEGEEEVCEMLAAGQAAELARLDNDFSESVAHLLAGVLSELGRLPDSDEARRALKRGDRRRRGLFGRMREAV